MFDQHVTLKDAVLRIEREDRSVFDEQCVGHKRNFVDEPCRGADGRQIVTFNQRLIILPKFFFQSIGFLPAEASLES